MSCDMEEIDSGCLLPEYHYGTLPSLGTTVLTMDSSLLSKGYKSFYSMDDPKLPRAKTCGKGFVRRPAMFTVTDDLRVSPISPTSGLSILMKMGVPYTDVEERTVLVGKEEALDLLVAVFNGSSCALTQVLLRKSQAKSQSG